MVCPVAIRFDQGGSRCLLFRYCPSGRSKFCMRVPAGIEFDKGGVWFGHGKTSVQNSVRLLGRTFDDPIVQEEYKLTPRKIINENNMPKYKISNKQEIKTYSPEELVAMILREVVRRASKQWDMNDFEAVVVVPNDYSEAQNRAMWKAIELSEIKVSKTIKQAAAVASIFNAVEDVAGSSSSVDKTHLNKSGNFLFLHLGYSNLDIVVITNDEANETIEIKYVSVDSSLGGDSFTRRLADRAVQEHNVPALNKKTREQLGEIFEEFKKLAQGDSKILVPILPDDVAQYCKSVDYMRERNWNRYISERKIKGRLHKLDREKFERECGNLFDSIEQQVEKAVTEAGIPRDDYNLVTLYGGGCNMLKVVEIIESAFPDVDIEYDFREQVGRRKTDIFPPHLSTELKGAGCLSFLESIDKQSPDYKAHKKFRIINNSKLADLIWDKPRDA